jgi:hypothetical protein
MLDNYNGAPDDVVKVLKDAGLIPDGGRLLFTEEFVGMTRVGDWFMPLGAARRVTNGVLAGELTFYADRQGLPQQCQLSLRIQRDPQRNLARSFTDVGLTSRGDVFLHDTVDGEEFPSVNEREPLNLAMGEAHHFLVIAYGDKVTVYVNGERVFDRVEVPVRGGVMGLSMQSNTSGTRCEGRKLWGYTFE